MGNTNNGSTAVAERRAENEAIVATSQAGTEAAANGGGDVAVENARLGKIREMYEADCAIARAVRDAEYTVADAYVNAGKAKTGANKREAADRDYSKALAKLREQRDDRIAAFAADSGNYSLVPAAQMAAVLNRAYARALDTLRQVLTSAQDAGIETLDDGDGLVWTVADRLAEITAVRPTGALETAQAS